MTTPVSAFSCAASHTNPDGFKVLHPSVNGPFSPHGQPPGYPSALGSGASRSSERSHQEVGSQRRWGFCFRMWLGTLSSSTSQQPLVLSLITRFSSSKLSFIIMVMLRGGCSDRQMGTAQVTQKFCQAACFHKASFTERLEL